MEENRDVKQLILMRHAKSSWDDAELEDQERPLNARGRKTAALMADYMQDARFEPSIVLCSSALRARQTLELLKPAFPKGTTIKVEPNIYSAAGNDLLTRIRRVSPAARSVLLVGHNPAMQELVTTLASESADLERIRAKFPTAAVAVLDAPIDEWKQLAPGEASLVAYMTPKRLAR